MADQTTIEWCDSTFNPWIGCTRVSPACDDCYAARSTPARTLGVAWGPGEARRRTADSTWALPKKWNAHQFVQCASCGWRGELRDFKGATGWTMCPACSGADWHGARRRVFCASLADVFDNEVPDEWRVDLLDLIRRCDNLDFLLLTKRVGNVTPMLRNVAALLRSEHGAQAERARGLQAGSERGTGDRFGGPRLADPEAHRRPLERWLESDTLPKGPSRATDAAGLSAGQSFDRREAALCSGGASGLASLQGRDPAGSDSQSQGWSEGSEPSVQPGAGHLQRAAAPCDPGPGRATPRCEGVEASEDDVDGSGRLGDAASTGSGLKSESDRAAVRRQPERGFADMPQHDLEARAALIAWIDRWIAGQPPANIWLGITVVNQAEVDRDVPKLLRVPAAVRFLSVEPMLGPINLRCIDVDGDHEIHPLTGTTECVDGEGRPAPDLPGISWVICGGESGPKARPMHPDWARSLRDQCAAAGVPFLFKQWGEWAEQDAGPQHQTLSMETNHGRRKAEACDGFLSLAGEFIYYMDDATTDDPYRGLVRIGKKTAGRQLDGRSHDEFPTA